ncbi:hypothetical protein MAPG_03563 [Magnaporthiopsis poae ATCC 64411]|uniref:Inheritance of peroxisomes protein 1 n=1 Tax=Magnaporthiopsis poae (strain ATCC 64411 / 73-15) TaxID=644358 RepID=A0A0C4DUC5_MAGP6|nr:hypothetical protein MAPG_03563 [Magnaporthiopsis poae ATCC 64411]
MDYARPPGSAFATPRRAATNPLPLRSGSRSQSPSPAAPAATPSGGIETLYSHPSVKIIAFSAGPRTLFAVGASGRGLVAPVDDIEPGTLPWSSQLERTIAVGPFRIYRAPGSVAFLNCGSALQPILPKSQCWCIDEISSKFVLQIRRPQYWRIEIPIGAADQAQALRDVFDKVLQFEKTPCPFQRAFHVELPEPSQIPVKKRPWAPTRRTSLQLPPTPISPEDLTPRAPLMGERTRATSFARNVDSPGALTPTLTPPTLTPTLPTIAKTSQEEVSKNGQHVKVEASKNSDPVKVADSPITNAITQQHPGFQASRSVMPPPQLSLLTSSPPRSIATTQSTRSLSGEDEEEASATTSPTNSSASFHSMRSWNNSPSRLLPPSPPMSNPNSPRTFPYPHENIPLPRRSSCEEQPSGDSALVDRLDECAVEDDCPSDAGADNQFLACASSPSDGCSVVSFEDASQVLETSAGTASAAVCSATRSRSNSPPRTRPRLRRRATSRSSISSSVGQYRALSPLPPGVNLFNPSRFHRSMADTPERAKTRMEAVRRIPSAIIHRTCEILLSPPGHLVSLMLKVAARIAAGEWRGLVFGIGEGGEKIPVQWDYSDSDSPAMPGQWDAESSLLYADAAPTPTRTGWESGGSLGRAASAILRSSTSPAAWNADNDDNDDDDNDVKHPDDGLDGDWSQRWTVD